MLSERLWELNPVKSICFAHETEHHFECQYSFKFQDFLGTLTLLSTCSLLSFTFQSEWPCIELNLVKITIAVHRSPSANLWGWIMLFCRMNITTIKDTNRKHKHSKHKQQLNGIWLQTNSKNSLKNTTPNVTRNYTIRFGGLEVAGMGLITVKKVLSHLSFRKTFSANKNTWIHHAVFLVAGRAYRTLLEHLGQKAENKAER